MVSWDLRETGGETVYQTDKPIAYRKKNLNSDNERKIEQYRPMCSQEEYIAFMTIDGNRNG